MSKRKGPDDGGDAGAALHWHLPSKKLRQVECDGNLNRWPDSRSLPDIQPVEGSVAIAEVCPVEIPSDTPVDSTPASLFVIEPDADERALVLYRPMDLHTRPIPRANGSFPRHYRDFQVCDAVEKFSPSKSFKHDFALSGGKGMGNNTLAVIPYVAPPPPTFHDDPIGGRVIIEDITDQVDQDQDEGDGDGNRGKDQGMAVEEEGDVEPMAVDEEMADATMMDDEVAPPPPPPPPPGLQPCDVQSWQQRFDPNFAPIMWSR